MYADDIDEKWDFLKIKLTKRAISPCKIRLPAKKTVNGINKKKSRPKRLTNLITPHSLSTQLTIEPL